MKMTTVLRLVSIGSLYLVVSCGGGVDKGPKKEASNNTSTNNVGTNNTSTNNVGTNNTSTNNIAANNISPNNVTPNNDQPCVGIAPASLNFGQVELPGSAQASVTLENCSTVAPLTLNGVTAPAGFDVLVPDIAELAPLGALTVDVVFTPAAASGYVGQVTVETSAGTAIVNVQGEGISTEVACPVAVAQGRADAAQPFTATVAARPQTTVELTGMNSTAEEPITSYRWTIIGRPMGSTARLTPGADVESPSLFVDLVGSYELDLSVTTANSPADCPAARVRVDAQPMVDPDAIHVELVWDTPTDADQTDLTGSDMDLHFLHPMGTWNTAPYDCYWLNPNPDWMADGRPMVDRDDVDGAGPETITHSNPGPLVYKIGVHYFADQGFGPSYASVRVRRGGVLLSEQLDVFMGQSDQFWYAGDIDASTDTVTPMTTITSGFPPP